jgi:hypothetical protein
MTKASQLTTLPFIMEGRLNNGYGGVNASLPCKVIAMVTVKGVKVVCSVVLLRREALADAREEEECDICRS